MVSKGALTASLGGLALFLPLLPGHPCGSAGVCVWGGGEKRRSGSEMLCLLGGDKPCKLTQAGKRTGIRKSYAGIREKENKGKGECF